MTERESSSTFSVKTMSKEDIPFAVSLTGTIKWDLNEEDFEFMMELEPKGCFVLLHNSKRIGVVTTIDYNHMSWLGNLIIDEQYRKKGAGTILASRGITHLTDRGVRTIGLYSYWDKIRFYERLGFRYDSGFTVLKGRERGLSSPSNQWLQQAEKSDIKRIVEYDYSCLGFSRAKLLEPILTKSKNLCFMAVENDELLGYGIAKVHNEFAEIGPLVCHRERGKVAVQVLSAIINSLDGHELFMCVPDRQRALIEKLLKHGLNVNFRVARMCRGEIIREGCVYMAESLERG